MSKHKDVAKSGGGFKIRIGLQLCRHANGVDADKKYKRQMSNSTHHII